jgi:hypothetical protein
MVGTTGYMCEKNKTNLSCYRTYRKISCKWILGLNAKGKIIKLVDKT